MIVTAGGTGIAASARRGAGLAQDGKGGLLKIQG
jgi:hypothetical protein